MSKGSNRRPTDEEKFAENFDAIFRKKKPEPMDLSQESLEKVLTEIQRNRVVITLKSVNITTEVPRAIH
jgi:hypothetical protein